MEERVSFHSEGLLLEGIFEANAGDRGVVITHPHPLYGGDMDNYVLEAIARAYHRCGYATLRFNFRGVGRSQGEHDNGIGEQEDVKAAISHLNAVGKKITDLTGYSFGAGVNTRAVARPSIAAKVRELVLVSPPVGMFHGEPASSLNCLQLIITGSNDDIAPADAIRDLCVIWNPSARLEVISGADHFYSGHTDTLESVLSSHLWDAEAVFRPTD